MGCPQQPGPLRGWPPGACPSLGIIGGLGPGETALRQHLTGVDSREGVGASLGWFGWDLLGGRVPALNPGVQPPGCAGEPGGVPPNKVAAEGEGRGPTWGEEMGGGRSLARVLPQRTLMGPWESGTPEADVRLLSHPPPPFPPPAPLRGRPPCQQGAWARQTHSQGPRQSSGLGVRPSEVNTASPSSAWQAVTPLWMPLENPGEATHTRWGLRTLKCGLHADLFPGFTLPPPRAERSGFMAQPAGAPQTSVTQPLRELPAAAWGHVKGEPASGRPVMHERPAPRWAGGFTQPSGHGGGDAGLQGLWGPRQEARPPLIPVSFHAFTPGRFFFLFNMYS